MSLLMEALKKAEKKNLGKADINPAPSEKDPMIEAAVPRAQAANLFQAKQPADTRRFVWGALLVAALLLVAIQGYRLWQVQTRPKLVVTQVAVPAPEPAILPQSDAHTSSLSPVAAGEKNAALTPDGPAAPTPATESASLPPGDSPDASRGAASQTAMPASTHAAPPPQKSDLSTQTVTTVPARPEPESTRPAVGKRLPGSPSPAPDERFIVVTPPTDGITADRVEIRRSNRPIAADSRVVSAYQAFLASNFTEAAQGYREVLKSDPHQRDALAGLAAIAVATGKPDEAGRIYGRLLELDPLDPLAQAGVMTYATDAPLSEARIKTLIGRQPQVPFLYFVLGNLYASQSNWPAAQQAFFDALRLEPSNPDYAFNLAVSLEHLRQGPLAAQYYQRALVLGDHRPAAFDTAAARDRLEKLGPPKTP